MADTTAPARAPSGGGVRDGRYRNRRQAGAVGRDFEGGLCERARTAGAEITMVLTDTDYGSRDFVARDPEGNHWVFGTYRGAPQAQ